MAPSDSERQLDNPIWWCLSTRHAHVAQGGPLARRYRADISPITGFPDTSASAEAVEALVAIGDDMGTFGPVLPVLPPTWETLQATKITQMIRVDRSPLPEGGVEASMLRDADVADMLALVELTQPGPFRRRTIELGRFIGIRENGRLLAMAGERMWVGDCREVSGICTHPDALGRGFARMLTGRIVNGILRAGETPFLHVRSANARAIGIYETLGFVWRAEFALLHARRLA